MKDRITVVADLLMAAAYADGRLEGEEKGVVRRLLREIMGGAPLSMDLEFRIEEFKHESFDLGEAGAAFADDAPDKKRRLLELLSAVHGADHEYDMAEDEFVHRVAAAIGLDEDSYHDLASTVLDEVDLAADLESVRRG